MSEHSAHEIDELLEIDRLVEERRRTTVREFPFEETRTVLSAAASRRVQEGYTVERAGGTLGLGTVRRSFLRLGAGYTVERVDVSGPSVPASDCGGRTWLLSAFAQAISLDRTDPLQPERGYKLRLALIEASGPLGGDYPFVRASPLAVVLAPLSPGVTMAGSVQFGVVLGEAPIYERFFGGGPTSVRSFDEGRLSPYAREANGAVVLVGGRSFSLASLELRVSLPPIPRVRLPLRAAVFADAGRVSVSAADAAAAGALGRAARDGRGVLKCAPSVHRDDHPVIRRARVNGVEAPRRAGDSRRVRPPTSLSAPRQSRPPPRPPATAAT